jgi:hypothetical protein
MWHRCRQSGINVPTMSLTGVILCLVCPVWGDNDGQHATCLITLCLITLCLITLCLITLCLITLCLMTQGLMTLRILIGNLA